MVGHSFRRRKTAIDLFINYFEETGQIMPKDEFDKEWNGGKNYWYTVRKQFMEHFDEIFPEEHDHMFYWRDM